MIWAMRKRQKNNAPYGGKGIPSIAFVVDGKTEEWYFKLMREAEELDVSFKFPSVKSDDITNFKEDIEDLLDSGKVFWIVDMDVVAKNQRVRNDNVYQLQFKKVLKVVDKHREKVVFLVNNPCLEFWYLRHVKDTQRYYPDYKQLLEELHKDRGFLGQYEKTDKFYHSGDGLYKKLRKDMDVAMERAKKLKTFDVKDFERAYAEIHIAIEDILKLRAH